MTCKGLADNWEFSLIVSIGRIVGEKDFLKKIEGSTIIESGMYEGIFKDFYHALHNQSDEIDLNFYLGECNPAKGKVLELACGDGRISIPLIKKGCSVIGVDNSEDQLEGLRNQLSEEDKKRAELFKQDILELNIDEEIAFAIMPATSINLVGENTDKLRGLFCKIYNLLQEGGLFLFDYRLFVNEKPSYYRYRINIKGEEYFVWMFESNDRKSKMSIFNMYMKSSQQNEYHRSSVRKRFFMPHEIYSLAEKSGFKIIREDNRVYSESIISKYIVLEK